MVGKVWLERQVCEGNQQAVFLLLRSAQLQFLRWIYGNKSNLKRNGKKKQ